MRQWLRSRLTYANVMATLAVFIALGGTALAGVMITKNRQVARDTISGHHPPTGDHPNIISGSVSRPDLSDRLRRSLKLRCPPGMGEVEGLCFETSDRDSATFINALGKCARAGRRLPTMGELALVFEHLGGQQKVGWVTNPMMAYNKNSGDNDFWTANLIRFAGGEFSFGAGPIGGGSVFRCVSSPTLSAPTN